MKELIKPVNLNIFDAGNVENRGGGSQFYDLRRRCGFKKEPTSLK